MVTQTQSFLKTLSRRLFARQRLLLNKVQQTRRKLYLLSFHVIEGLQRKSVMFSVKWMKCTKFKGTRHDKNVHALHERIRPKISNSNGNLFHFVWLIIMRAYYVFAFEWISSPSTVMLCNMNEYYTLTWTLLYIWVFMRIRIIKLI